jgi:O-methyltransferase
MSPYRTARDLLGRHLILSRLNRIYHKFRGFTMMPERAYVHTLQIAQTAVGLKGCVVECGVWRGGTAAGLISVLGTSRKLYLFDSFEGLPPAQQIDGEAALEYQKNIDGPMYFDNCYAPPCYAERAMELAGASNYEMINGWFNETLPQFRVAQPIAVLHLDADWYDSILTCLNHLFDSVIEGGLIIIDDYYVWDGCSRAVHDYLSKRSGVERIREFGGVCYLKKEIPNTHPAR